MRRALQPSKVDYFWARHSGKICWWGTYFPTAFILGFSLSHGEPLGSGWLYFTIWLVSTILLSIPVTFLVLAFFVGPLIGSIERQSGRTSLHTGDLVRILTGPHRDRILRVYDVWPERNQVRVQIDEQAGKDVEDVFSCNEVFLARNAYTEGRGPSPEMDKELTALTESAQRGDAEAQYNLGRRYFEGDGTLQDKTRALHWLTQAAELGNGRAQFVLGRMFFEGDTVPDDKAKALHWYTEAAKQGHAEAQYELARTRICHPTDRMDTPSEERSAFDWGSKAAEQGHVGAQRLLSGMYLLGIGVPEDYSLAYAWEKLSTHKDPQGHWVRKMTPEQLRTANEMAARLTERIPPPTSAFGLSEGT